MDGLSPKVDIRNVAFASAKNDTPQMAVAKIEPLLRQIEEKASPNAIKMLMACVKKAQELAPEGLEIGITTIINKLKSYQDNIQAADARDIRTLAREAIRFPAYLASVEKKILEDAPDPGPPVQQHVHLHVDTQRQLQEMEARRAASSQT